MPIYPIEISKDLNSLISKNNLFEALNYDANCSEKALVKGISLLEHGQPSEAERLFKQYAAANNEPPATEQPQKSVSYALACQVELLFLKPLEYSTQRDVIKSLKGHLATLPKQRLLARMLHGLAIVMQWQRNTPLALKYLLESRDIYRDLSETTGLSHVLDSLGNVTATIADHEQALLFYSESLALKITLNDRMGQAITLGNLGRLCLQLGRYQQAHSFVQMNIDILINEKDKIISNPETQARLLNLLARIDMAAQQWAAADDNLKQAISLLTNSSSDSLFFCIKDQISLLLNQGITEDVETKLSRLKTLLPKASKFHQIQYQMVTNHFQQLKNNLTIEDAQTLLEDVEFMDLPELELELRLKLSVLATELEQPHTAQQQLLLARKMARRHGFKRFLPSINTLMIQLDIHENIQEKTIRTISDKVADVDDGYLMRKRLGGGGFGDVFLAFDMTNDRDVALKRFHAGDLHDHQLQRKRWNQARLEFEAVASISHPSIAKVYAIGHDSTGSPYLVQEFIPGGDITQLMTRSSDLKSTLTYLIPIARALAATHEIGIIHRDIKPENILVNKQGILVLVDFGIALLKQPTEQQTIQGTEFYIAPEQRESANITFKVDLFSLGCVLYEWLSKSKVDIEKTQQGKLARLFGFHLEEKITAIDKTICGIAYPLIKQLLAFDPEDRPESATAVAEQMQSLVKQL